MEKRYETTSNITLYFGKLSSNALFTTIVFKKLKMLY